MNNIFSPSHIDRAKGKKVIAIDIDDVLANSIPEWISFTNTYKRQCVDIKQINEDWVFAHYSDLYILKKNIPYYYYRLLKSKYRESLVKAHLPINKYVHEFMEYLRSEKYTIIIITKRPSFCSKLTYEWLYMNSIVYDEVIFDRNKHVVVLKRFPELKYMIEDNLDIARHVAKWGYKIFLMDNIYNQGETPEFVYRVNNLEEVEAIMKIGEN